MATAYLEFAMEVREVSDLLIDLLEKPRFPHESELRELKDETLAALRILSTVESKALFLSREA